MQRLARAVALAGVTPNAVSVAGMLAALSAGVLLLLTGRVEPGSLAERACWLGAIAGIQFRLVCNLIDGMVAVEGCQRSAVGEVYNEVPDRVSDAAVLIGAGYAATSSPEFGYIAAMLAVFVAYVRAVGKGCGLASDYCGPLAKQQRMFAVCVGCLLGAALPPEWRHYISDGIPHGLMTVVLWIIIGGTALTGLRRLLRLTRALRARGV